MILYTKFVLQSSQNNHQISKQFQQQKISIKLCVPKDKKLLESHKGRLFVKYIKCVFLVKLCYRPFCLKKKQIKFIH